MSMGILNGGNRWRQALRPAAEATMPEVARHAATPAVLCRLSGRVIAVNGAMAAAGGRGQTLEALLGMLVDFDAALIYRLSRSASAVGFALEQVRARRITAMRYLSAVRIGDDAVLWRVLDGAALAQAVLPSLADHYEAAPFGYLYFENDGSVSSNIRFRDLFGQETAPVIAEIRGGDGRIREGCHHIARGDGTRVWVRVLAPCPSETERAREIFFFDPAEEEAAGIAVPVQEVDDLPIAVMRLSAGGQILSMNGHAARLLDHQARAGQPVDELLTCRGRRLSSVIEAAGEARETVVETVAGTTGQIRPLQVSLAAANDATGSVIAVLTDATELELLQDKYAQSQKMEAVGKLAGGVAHDFNNLITAINGHCDLLLIGKDATQPEYSDLMQIRQNANRAAALVRQLLAFSRKQTLNPENLSIGDVISDTLYLLDRLIGDQVKLRLDPDPLGPVGQVRADHRQLEQALMNLVVNARDAMPNGGVVTISTRRRMFRVDEQREAGVIPAGDYVELAVADEGTGIDEAVIDKVFDPFFTTKAQGEGTGLGLSTVYGIVNQSGGHIFAENRPEGGACFRMLFPRVEATTAEEVRPEKPVMDLTGHGSVLLVEDEAAVRSFAARALRLRGYDVTTAEEADEALAILEESEQPFDLIVSDVMMPGMDGPSFVVEARKLRPTAKILFVSGYAEEAFYKEIDNPDYHFLPKPFSLSELTSKVKEVLSTD